MKIIGATSHYVTEDLDEGPIIDQDIIRISHRDSVNDHAEHRILVNGKKTVVFE